MENIPPQEVFAPWDDPQAKPLIALHNVTKRFGKTAAVDAVDLEIYERECFALLGPSGCGKTTLLRILAGFETPTEGAIKFAGRDLVPIPPNRREVNMMFQSYALFPHLSVRDNIAFGLRRSDMPKSLVRSRVEEMLRLTRLEELAHRMPHRISGGQQQRVALARSLARAPKLLLLDEPLSALDRKLRQETLLELMDIHQRTGTTFVIVTHDREEAMTIASRIAVMDRGKIVQVDTPNGIYEFPNSVNVADFIGEANIIEGSAGVPDESGVSVNWAEGRDVLTGPPHGLLSDGQRCALVIRPEKITVSGGRPEGAGNAVEGKVLDVVYLGNISTYRVELPTGHVIRAEIANTERNSQRGHTCGDTVWLSWSDSAGIVLPT